MQLKGIHHLTAVSADAPGNLAFYAGTLGMRLVKKTVNQDDVSAYHLFYADALGSPGTDITFFDWPVGRDGRLVLDFEDPEGQRLFLIDDGGTGDAHSWDRSPVPAPHQIRGLGPITISVPELEATDRVLTRVMGMRPARQYSGPDGPEHTVHVYEMGDGGPGAELHVAVQPGLPRAQSGAGGVHHVAFRSPDADYDAWAERLTSMRIANSGKIDRYYFRSLYFREPHGILFEIATDGPGFASDEPLESLGERLALPPFLEPRRAEIEANLKPL